MKRSSCLWFSNLFLFGVLVFVLDPTQGCWAEWALEEGSDRIKVILEEVEPGELCKNECGRESQSRGMVQRRVNEAAGLSPR